jgi:hypothetical protein
MKRKWIRIAAWTIGVVAILSVAASIALTYGLRGFVKSAVITVLRERFDSEVEIRDIRILIFPRVYVVAYGIVLRHEGRTDIPPFLIADKLTVGADLRALFETPRRVASVQLEGLQIHVPPREDKNAAGDNAASQNTAKPSQPKKPFPIVISEITADHTVYVMLPKDPSKVPLEFDIHHLVLEDAGVGHAMPFHASLRNPKPVGDIDTHGQLGPWDPETPSLTPVQGEFSFSHADLATLKGISGILSSAGKYNGVLEKINVEGDTDTPDFALQFSAKPVDLKTHYVAIVDGTNGDTYLTSVTAKFLHSTIQTSGKVVKVRGSQQRQILLDASARDTRVEDLLHLVVKGDQPVMTGAADLNCKIDLPPVQGSLFDKLILNGRFGIAGAHFSSSGIQGKVDALSRRGQGEPKNEAIENVISNLQGQFTLKNKLATFSDLGFDVTGARVQLAGTYNLESEAIDFSGHLLLKAKLSQLTTGAKSFLLRPFDSFFQKNGAGTSLPIRITGTRSSPSFGLDFHHNDKKTGANDAKNPKAAMN